MNTQPDLFGILPATAILSPDGRYRYVLTRQWTAGDLVTWVMLNPSTADAEHDDPTIRRCVKFAKTWGYAGIHVVNLFAYRATDPRELATVDNPIGPHNDHHLREYAHAATTIVAWGAHSLATARAEDLRSRGVLPQELLCVGLTNSGAPRHPLYVRDATTPKPWPLRRQD